MSSPAHDSSQIQQLLDRLPAGFWILDRELRFTFSTGGAFEAVGLTPENLYGVHIHDALGTADPAHPAVRAHREALEGKTSSYLLDWGGHHFRSRVTPLREASGEIIGVSGLAIEDTERVLAEAELWRREQQLRVAEELSRSGSVEYNRATGEVRWSDGLYRVFGFDPGAVPPSVERIVEHTEREDQNVIEELFALPVSGDDTVSRHLRIRRPDGERRVLFVRATVEPVSKGPGDRVLTTFRDVTYEYERERELLASTQRFEMVARATSDIIWDWDLVSGEVWRGRGSERLTGCMRETRPSKDLWIPNIHPDDRERVHRGLLDALDSADEFWREYYCLQCGDGTVLHVADRAYIIRDSAGKAVRMVGAVTDVSQQRAAEEALRSAEDQFRSMVEQSVVGVYIATADEILYANPKALEIFGYDPKGPTPRSPLDLIHPADRDAARTALLDHLADRSQQSEYRVRCLRRDGKKIVVDFSWTKTRFTGQDAVLGILVDTTSRVRAEKELAARERWFRTLIENASDGIGVLGLDGTILYESPSVEPMLGWHPSDLVGDNVLTRVHPEDRPAASRYIAGLVEGTRRSPLELRYRHKNGSWRTLEAVVTTATDLNDEQILIANYRDVTETRSLQRQVESNERINAFGRVASSMAHEFNNVLMGIQPFAEILSSTSDPEKLALATRQITASIRRGRNVTDQVLRFTRGDREALAPVRVQSWLKAQLAEIRAGTPEAIHLELDLPEDDLRVQGNPEQLQQMLLHLVSNAVDSMPSGGVIRISADRARRASWSFGHVEGSGTMLHLSVADTGVGIDLALHQQIFEPLFTTRKGTRAGMGLALVRQIVSAHDGHIFVESLPERGATFHVFLPLSADRPDDPIVRGEDGLDPRIRRVLLIEDEENIAEGLQILFGMIDVDLQRASTGEEGIELFRTIRPDAVILDVGLPDIEGEEVFRRIRALDDDVPIIFATGHAGEERLRTFLRKPRTAFLRKPFELEILIEALNSVLR
jgi:two-component system, cell cycle sensor histidine kinase and response regulator CckA